MGDFSYLGRARLEQARSLIASADSMLQAGRPEVALVSLRGLLDDVFGGGGSAGPDDGAVDQLATVVAALGGDEEQMSYLVESAEDDGEEFGSAYLVSYALDDLRGIVDYELGRTE